MRLFCFQGTVAEKYLLQHRHITPETIDRLAFRSVPIGATYNFFDYATGTPRPKLNKYPKLVVPVYNKHNQLTGIQRIYLDPKTNNKTTDLEKAKLSKGTIRGSLGLVQKGIDETVYLVEGPETGASVACACPTSTVVSALSANNLYVVAPVLEMFQPKEIVIGADLDLNLHTQFCINKAFRNIRTFFGKRYPECVVRLVYPGLAVQTEEDEMKGVDWNDVLKKEGVEAVAAQMR